MRTLGWRSQNSLLHGAKPFLAVSPGAKQGLYGAGPGNPEWLLAFSVGTFGHFGCFDTCTRAKESQFLRLNILKEQGLFITPRATHRGHLQDVFNHRNPTWFDKIMGHSAPKTFMDSQHPSPHVKNCCNFEPQIWPEIITSRDAKSTCFKGSRTSCDVIIFGIFLVTFCPKISSHHMMDPSCRVYPLRPCTQPPSRKPPPFPTSHVLGCTSPPGGQNPSPNKLCLNQFHSQPGTHGTDQGYRYRKKAPPSGISIAFGNFGYRNHFSNF